MSTKRPVIGITVDYNDLLTQYVQPHSYCTAVEVAGGVPFMLPYRSDLSLVPDFVDLIDGMIFTGGLDLDPTPWGEERHPMAKGIDPHRETFERAMMAEVEKRRTPTLGICLGSQLMNVYRGGSLNQFIPDLGLKENIEHRRLGTEWNFRHEVTIEPGTVLAKAIGGTKVHSNSSHKQSVKEVGRGLRVAARAPDGIVEAVEDPSMPLWLGVQWHPERQHDEPEQIALFKMLIKKAREYAKGKK